jgi:hypothetical protein
VKILELRFVDMTIKMILEDSIKALNWFMEEKRVLEAITKGVSIHPFCNEEVEL